MLAPGFLRGMLGSGTGHGTESSGAADCVNGRVEKPARGDRRGDLGSCASLQYTGQLFFSTNSWGSTSFSFPALLLFNKVAVARSDIYREENSGSLRR